MLHNTCGAAPPPQSVIISIGRFKWSSMSRSKLQRKCLFQTYSINPTTALRFKCWAWGTSTYLTLLHVRSHVDFMKRVCTFRTATWPCSAARCAADSPNKRSVLSAASILAFHVRLKKTRITSNHIESRQSTAELHLVLSFSKFPTECQSNGIIISNNNHPPGGSSHWGHLGLSENSVPLNPMVNDHYPY